MDLVFQNGFSGLSFTRDTPQIRQLLRTEGHLYQKAKESAIAVKQAPNSLQFCYSSDMGSELTGKGDWRNAQSI
jgi:hypothetical protein